MKCFNEHLFVNCLQNDVLMIYWIHLRLETFKWNIGSISSCHRIDKKGENLMKKEIMDKKNHWIQYDTFDSHVIHAFTLKPYNFSSLIQEETKEKFYQTLTKDLSCPCEIVKPKQEHTDVIKIVTEENKKDPFLSVDGLLTNIPKVALVTSYADCQAIFLYDPVHKVIGNIHSGWKGTIKKILRKAILMMQEVYGSTQKISKL